VAQPEQDEYDVQRDQAVRDAAACPECTAGRSELCRDVHGAEVEMHPLRAEVYARDFLADDEPDDEPSPALGRVSARARGTVTRKSDIERKGGQGESDHG
jgi:hypothetical protein